MREGSIGEVDRFCRLHNVSVVCKGYPDVAHGRRMVAWWYGKDEYFVGRILSARDGPAEG